jgi:hypothetical protein
VNGKDLCDDVWIVRDGFRLKLRMLTRGEASPYDIYLSLTGKKSAIEAMKYAAVCVDTFIELDDQQADFFRVASEISGRIIPINPMDQPYHLKYLPRELDEVEGRLVAI